jgi:hypothetical protein
MKERTGGDHAQPADGALHHMSSSAAVNKWLCSSKNVGQRLVLSVNLTPELSLCPKPEQKSYLIPLPYVHESRGSMQGGQALIWLVMESKSRQDMLNKCANGNCHLQNGPTHTQLYQNNSFPRFNLHLLHLLSINLNKLSYT